MAVKAIQAKVIIDSPEKIGYLWLTHRLFNDSLPFMIQKVFKMKRGELGEDLKKIYDSISSSQDSFKKLEPITQLKAPRKLGSGKNKGDWAKKALEINRLGKILFDRHKELAFGSEFWRKLCEITIQLIHGHEELKKIWEEEHKKWLADKKGWEEKNPEFMKVLPLYEDFEKKAGALKRQRGRWHLYLEFLRSHPELAAWADRKSELNDFSQEEEKELRKRFYRKPGKILEAFLNKNPQLKALDKKYGEYCELTRPWSKRKNKDGFKHPPTFTMPSPIKHPIWYTFKNGDTYKELDIKNGTLKLKVLTSENGKGRKGEWISISFKADERLNSFQYIGKKGKGKKEYSYLYSDPELGEKRAEIRGIKLIFKGSRFDVKTSSFIPGEPYLIFTCEIEDENSRLSLKQKYFDKYPADWLRERVFPGIKSDELITCAVDLGIRHLGVATICKGNRLLRTKFLKLKGLSLAHIAEHQKALRHGRRLRGKPIKGEESFADFQKHITNMGEDRFKKGAHEIVSFAYENSADIIVLENLKGFIANATYEKGINKAMARWNRGNLVKWIKQTAQYYGIRVIEVDAFYSSRLCAKCGAPGVRYTIKNGLSKREWVGKLFACYECGYRVNADFNASLNLHKIFHKIFFGKFPKKDSDLFYNSEIAVMGGKVYNHEIGWQKLQRQWNSNIVPPHEDTKIEQF
jgi:IS605 OrfB family transposase